METSILFPSKFADISVKATQNQEDEAQHIRREKLAIEEIRGLLAEMLNNFCSIRSLVIPVRALLAGVFK